MKSETYLSRSENDTRKIAKDFATELKGGTVVLLFGDLGAGKTVFVRGVGEAFGVSGVRSPSFTLINEYETGSGLLVVHADLYRLDPEGVNAIGLDEYAGADDTVLFVEWPERWVNPPVQNTVKIFFDTISETEREIRIEAE